MKINHFLSTFQVNWLEALRQCRLMGLQLATIPGQEEDDAIMNFKKQNSNYIKHIEL